MNKRGLINKNPILVLVVFLIIIVFVLSFFSFEDLSGSVSSPSSPSDKISGSSILGKDKIKLFDNTEIQDFSIPQNSEYKQIKINKVFEQDEIYNLDYQKQIVSLSLNAIYSLEDSTSTIRVILVDSLGNEFLVNEISQMFYDSSNIQVNNTCEESCNLDNIFPKQIRFEIYGGKIELKEINIQESSSKTKSLLKDKISYDRNQKSVKLKKLKGHLSKKQAKWSAGETSISKLTYAEKKKLFSSPDGSLNNKLPNLQGFEYYHGGIFNAGSVAGKACVGIGITHVSTPLNWDWRNKHGENWVSPIRNQGACGSCWDFAALGAVEGVINLYYNQHLNVDLSEQQSICNYIQERTCKNGGWVNWPLKILMEKGLKTEKCMPYTAKDNCPTSCNTPSWRITYYSDVVDNDDEDIKTKLIEKGPLTFCIDSWWHCMTLVGFNTNTGNLVNTKGDTVWILKNSWGPYWGEDGYTRMIISCSDRFGMKYIEQPIDLSTKSKIVCVDKDKDNYCNWGISKVKPQNCPINCNLNKDCDDSNPTLNIKCK